ncbi:hypothetical protein L2E82_44033 [Cichorium intybus]|uniref:Uncharacterized protein n=1 Tax=Cichorium intybus TaxID=13427 RepID=A0ACB8ZQM1_CICIN|nr:hypothetical protein L2E82_44033 [Cichorium intybus]
MEFLIIALALFLSYALVQVTLTVFRIGNPKNLPPGPTPLPIIGNLHLLGDQPHQSLDKLAKIYGPVMFLKLGRTTALVISSAAAAKEVLQKQDLAFSSRHIPDAFTAHNQSIYSVVWLPVATQWRTLRRILKTNIFASHSLDTNQHLRKQKVQELVGYCHKASQSGDSVDIGRAAFRTTLNLLSNTICSKDLTDPYEDSGKEFKELVGNIMVDAGKPNLVDFFPVLKKIDPQGIRKRMTYYFGKVFDMFEILIEERLGMEGPKYDDLLDVYLNIIKENPDEINRTHMKSMFLKGNLVMIWFIGSDLVHWKQTIIELDIAGFDGIEQQTGREANDFLKSFPSSSKSAHKSKNKSRTHYPSLSLDGNNSSAYTGTRQRPFESFSHLRHLVPPLTSVNRCLHPAQPSSSVAANQTDSTVYTILPTPEQNIQSNQQQCRLSL